MKGRISEQISLKKRKMYRRTVFHWLLFLAVILLLSRLALFLNQNRVNWLEGRYTKVTLSQSGERIVVVDSKTGLAGALDLDGKEVIPVDSEVFDPWDGSLINGLRQEGNLFWVIKDNKVGIVNEDNKVVIPQNYGYLEKTYEDQFIAGNGQISDSITSGGVYTYQKYGVIRENGGELIPLEYDSMKTLDDGRYEGIIKEDTRTITRTFFSSGNMQTEKIEEKEEPKDEEEPEADTKAEAETDSAEQEETEGGSAVGETQNGETGNEGDGSGSASVETGNGDNVGEEKPPVGEDSGIEDYDGPGIDSDILHYYVTGDSTRLHLGGNVCTLEDEYENVLVTFEGNRVKENMPQFSNRNQLVIDEGEDFYRVYNASSGVMLCDVKKEADCIVTDRFIVYEQAAEYIVKNYKNTEIFRTEKGTDDHFLNSKEEQARFIFQNAYFVYQSDGGRTLITNSGVVVAEGLDSILFNDENNDKEKAEEQIFICEKNEKYGAFNAAGDKILDFIYENAEFFNGHVNALRIKQESGKEGIVDYTGKVIIPLEYDSVGYGNYIEEAGNASIVEYQLINSRLDSYYGKQGSRIYYLDEEGNKTEEVQYVKTTENGRDLNDYLTLNKTPETPKEYSTTGNILVMDNAYSGSAGFGRSRIYENVEQNKIRFLLIDENSSKIGVFEYYFGDFTFMGYQHWIWYIWMLGSRIFLLLLLAWIVLKLPYEEIADRFYFFRKDFTRKKMTKKKNGK